MINLFEWMDMTHVKLKVYSDMFGNTSTFRHIISPVFFSHLLEAFPFKDLFTFRIFVGNLFLQSLIFGLPFHGFCNLLISELFKSHGRHVVSRSEYLFFVLLSHVDYLISSFLLNDDSLFGGQVLVGLNDTLTCISFIRWPH